jgi:hypothetical protein
LLLQKNRAEKRQEYFDKIVPASSPKANEPKKKRPEMPTSSKTGACYTCLIGATLWDEVRAISGLPPRPKLSEALNFLWLLSLS